MEKPKIEETRTDAQPLEDLPVDAKKSDQVKGGAVDMFKTKQSDLLPAV